MWIRVALDKNAVHYSGSLEYTYVDGENIKEFYFDDVIAKELGCVFKSINPITICRDMQTLQRNQKEFWHKRRI